ncbi:hypothetical protein NDN08_003380 [Rhodosorus marinus]|uniref:Phosphoglycerate mutase (2,3-diphosphoglycerate-dependent) n=1 Tax=Rhodosorus marinus TaxID=101924 RepID=A0AAV8V293_9RHOD|nr:hypothetical protein NDN08_003380 [Rhodosorus marinus]
MVESENDVHTDSTSPFLNIGVSRSGGVSQDFSRSASIRSEVEKGAFEGFSVLLMTGLLMLVVGVLLGATWNREWMLSPLIEGSLTIGIGTGIVVFVLIGIFFSAAARHSLPWLDEFFFSVSKYIVGNRMRHTQMCRPKRIVLVRHGQSIGNVDKNVYKSIPDNKLSLTTRGYEQALEAGKKLKATVQDETTLFFTSPYVRTKQTLQGILVGGNFDESKISVREDSRLREQEFGNFQDPGDWERVAEERRRVGRFWYRIPEGESGADVYDRVTIFLQTMYREMDAVRPRNQPLENIVIVSHGLAIRLFCMRYLHWTVEEFDQVWNPHNCESWTLEKTNDGRYELVTPIQIGKQKECLMPLSMRVPHRELGQDLEAYLTCVKGHTLSSPILDGSAIDPTELARSDTSELGSMRTVYSKAKIDMVNLREALERTETQKDLIIEQVAECESEDEQEDGIFTLSPSLRPTSSRPVMPISITEL